MNENTENKKSKYTKWYLIVAIVYSSCNILSVIPRLTGIEVLRPFGLFGVVAVTLGLIWVPLSIIMFFNFLINKQKYLAILPLLYLVDYLLVAYWFFIGFGKHNSTYLSLSPIITPIIAVITLIIASVMLRYTRVSTFNLNRE